MYISALCKTVPTYFRLTNECRKSMCCYLDMLCISDCSFSQCNGFGYDVTYRWDWWGITCRHFLSTYNTENWIPTSFRFHWNGISPRVHKVYCSISLTCFCKSYLFCVWFWQFVATNECPGINGQGVARWSRCV